jgi:hypothetical protein
MPLPLPPPSSSFLGLGLLLLNCTPRASELTFTGGIRCSQFGPLCVRQIFLSITRFARCRQYFPRIALLTLRRTHLFQQIMFVLLTGCPTNLFPFDGALMCVRRWSSSVLLLLLILTR